MKIKILNKKFQSILNTFDEILKTPDYQGLEFGLAILKNKKIVKEQIDQIVELITPSEEFKQYESKRLEILKEFSKDENGVESVTDMGNGTLRYNISDTKQVDFEKSITDLRNEYLEHIVAFENKQKDYSLFLNKESEVEVVSFNQAILPKNIKLNHLEIIEDFIE